jgi:RNA polymerase sigma-70 factor, ECF subfamily
VDQDAQFKGVIEAHRDRIYRIACCYLRDENDRQDICQEVTVHIWRSLAAFQGRSGLGTWVYRIAVNTCLDHVRAARRRSRVMQDGLPEESEVSAGTACESGPELEDDVRQLHECVRRLPPLQRTLISLYLEDVGTREMAEILGISEGNVRVKLHRAKQAVRDLWKE